MKYLKKYRLFESNPTDDERRENDIRDISLEFEDAGLICSISKIRKDVELEDFWKKSRVDKYLEIYLSRPWNSPNREIPGVVNPEGGYPGNLFFWYEIKDTVIRLAKWYYEVEGIYEPIDKSVVYTHEKDQSPLRFFGYGIEMFIGFSKEEDFEKVGDFISFTNFRIMIRI
jgi:hypothetical protein